MLQVEENSDFRNGSETQNSDFRNGSFTLLTQPTGASDAKSGLPGARESDGCHTIPTFHAAGPRVLARSWKSELTGAVHVCARVCEARAASADGAAGSRGFFRTGAVDELLQAPKNTQPLSLMSGRSRRKIEKEGKGEGLNSSPQGRRQPGGIRFSGIFYEIPTKK